MSSPPFSPSRRPARRSPFAEVDVADDGIAEPGVALADRPFLGKVDLRGAPADAGFVAAVEAVLGVDLPRAVGDTATGDAVTVLCLGPDEWLIVTAVDGQGPLAAALTDALAGRAAAVTDLSSGWAALRLAGPRAREVLAKGCPVDLDPPAFGPGRCAETRLGAVHAVIHQWSADPVYDLYVGRSFARSALAWLVDAGREYGVAWRPDPSAGRGPR